VRLLRFPGVVLTSPSLILSGVEGRSMATTQTYYRRRVGM
jgi:hypothetical protein